jgi:hypothetical protein
VVARAAVVASHAVAVRAMAAQAMAVRAMAVRAMVAQAMAARALAKRLAPVGRRRHHRRKRSPTRQTLPSQCFYAPGSAAANPVVHRIQRVGGSRVSPC